MKRYIDANKITLRLERFEDEDGLLVPVASVKKAISQTPTEDVVDVVRCKDCKSCRRQSDQFGNIEYYCQKMNLHRYVSPCDFCSHGERREAL